MQMFDCIIVYVLEELTLSLHKGQREGQRDRYLDSMIIDGVHTENTEGHGWMSAGGQCEWSAITRHCEADEHR